MTDRPPHECRAQLEDLVTGGNLVLPGPRLAANGLEVERGQRSNCYGNRPTKPISPSAYFFFDIVMARLAPPVEVPFI